MQIPRHETDLWIGPATEPEHIERFMRVRTLSPAVVDDAVVWNYHNRRLDAQALYESGLAEGSYVVPYQISSVWAAMTAHLPPRIADADVLSYDVEAGEYRHYESFRASVSPLPELDPETLERAVSRAQEVVADD